MTDIISKAGPRPWILCPLPARDVRLKRDHWAIGRHGGKGIALAFGDDAANAALIVKAVNAHEALVYLAEQIIAEYDENTGLGQIARAALARAESPDVQ